MLFRSPALLSAPSAQEQIEQTLRVASMATRVSDKLTLLQSALTQLTEAGGTIPSDLAKQWRKSAQEQIRAEQDVDRKYAAFSARYAGWARDAARKARIRIVERMLDDVDEWQAAVLANTKQATVPVFLHPDGKWEVGFRGERG